MPTEYQTQSATEVEFNENLLVFFRGQTTDMASLFGADAIENHLIYFPNSPAFPNDPCLAIPVDKLQQLIQESPEKLADLVKVVVDQLNQLMPEQQGLVLKMLIERGNKTKIANKIDNLTKMVRYLNRQLKALELLMDRLPITEKTRYLELLQTEKQKIADGVQSLQNQLSRAVALLRPPS